MDPVHKNDTSQAALQRTASWIGYPIGYRIGNSYPRSFSYGYPIRTHSTRIAYPDTLSGASRSRSQIREERVRARASASARNRRARRSLLRS